MNQLDPYHTIAFNLWLDGYDLATFTLPEHLKRTVKRLKRF